MTSKASVPDPQRRSFLRRALGAVATAGVAGASALAARRGQSDGLVWQLDPDVCIQCSTCEEACVLDPSAVKCIQQYDMCGYCTLCFGYHRPDASALDTAAENQLCPTGAIERRFIEKPYFEYNIDESLCTGCAICVRSCSLFGNGSFYLQVKHDQCVDCNECAIARECPVDAFRRVPASDPYLFKAGMGMTA